MKLNFAFTALWNQIKLIHHTHTHTTQYQKLVAIYEREREMKRYEALAMIDQ